MRKWLPLLAICLGSFMLLVDVTIVNVALPDMADDLSSSFASLQWVIDAYALVLAALLLVFGSLSDAIGHRQLYVAGLAVFAAASVLCGAAVGPGMIVAARAVQGLGGAAMFATVFGLLAEQYHGRERGTAFGILGAVSGAASAVGPVLGGVLTQAISWRWIFFVNVPIAVVTIVLTLAVISLPAETRHRTVRRPEIPGTIGFVAAAAALTFAFTRSSDSGWVSGPVLSCLAVAVVGAVVFVVAEKRSTHPLLDLSLFARPVFTGSVSAALVLSFSAFGVLTYITIWNQTVLGLSPTAAGLVCVPQPILSAIVSYLSGRFMDRLPRALTIGGGLLLIGAGCLLTVVLIRVDGSWPALLPGLVLIGVGTGVSVPAMSAAATASAGDRRAGVASGAMNTARQLGQALAIALLGSLAASAAASSLRSAGLSDPGRIAGQLIGGGGGGLLSDPPAGAGPALAGALRSAFSSGLVLAYVVAGVAAVLTAVLAVALLRSRPGGTGTEDADGEPPARTAEPGESAEPAGTAASGPIAPARG